MAGKPRRSASIGRGPLGRAAQMIAERRLALGLTQVEVADLAELSPVTVRAVESGRGGVRLDILIRLLDVLGLSLLVVPRSVARAMAAQGEGEVLAVEGAPPPGEGARS